MRQPFAGCGWKKLKIAAASSYESRQRNRFSFASGKTELREDDRHERLFFRT
jgi:hypothetical protein